MSTENTGYTLNGVAGRIRDLESKTNGAYYVALCWLAMAKNSGKQAKKLLEGKIFGQDKPTSTFRNAWRIADKAFAAGFPLGDREAAKLLTLDDAIKHAIDRLEAHKLALEVSNMKDYEERCKFTSLAEAEATAESEPEAEPEQEPAKDLHDIAENAENTAADEPERDLLAEFAEIVSVLDLEQAMDAAKLLANRIADLQETAEIEQKKAA